MAPTQYTHVSIIFETWVCSVITVIKSHPLQVISRKGGAMTRKTAELPSAAVDGGSPLGKTPKFN